MASNISTDDVPSTSAAPPSADRRCEVCSKLFDKPSYMKRHLQSCKVRKSRTCGKCGHTFASNEMYNKHGCDGGRFTCNLCEATFTQVKSYIRHSRIGGCGFEPYRLKEYRVNCVPDANGVVTLNFKDTAGDVFFCNLDNKILDPLTFFSKISNNVEGHITQHLRKWRCLKVNFSLEAVYVKPSPDPSSELTKDACFYTKSSIVTQTSDLENLIDESFARLSVDVDEFESSGSGWSLLLINGLLVRLTKFRPLGGGSSYIRLPRHIEKKKAVQNVKSVDDQCFKHAILSSFFYNNTFQQEVFNPDLCHNLNFDGIEYPTPLDQIKIFELNNNVTVNVYALDDRKNVFPLRISSFENSILHFRLLLLNNGDKHHYCLITDLSRLVRSQRSQHVSNHLICERCFTQFRQDYVSVDGLVAEQRMARHMVWCKENCPTRVLMPKAGSVVNFKNLLHKQRVPVVVYADFEALIVPYSTTTTSQSIPSVSTHAPPTTRSIAHHDMFAVGVLVVSTIPTFQPYPNIITMQGLDVADQLMAFLKNFMGMLDELYDVELQMNLTPQQEQEFIQAVVCGICNKPLIRPRQVIVKHHCHMTGNFICAAHQACNLNYKHPNFLPVFFHNLTNYDSHPIVQALAANDDDAGSVKVLANSKEKFISISRKFAGTKRWVRFLDSYRFMASSLDKLANNLPSHPRLTEFVSDPQKRQLLLRKGVFPYSYLSDMNKLNDTVLPPKEWFRNDLTDEHITDQDYEHAKTVWTAFDCQTLLDYSTIYLKTDVYLLCEVFETFRDLTMQNYQLDAAWYYTLPSLSFDAMKLMTGAKIDLVSDYDQHMFIERGVRGGITTCVQRHAVANNKHLPDTYNPNLPSTYLLLLDCTNLYGTAMSRFKLPSGGFEWVDANAINIQNLPEADSDFGYLLEVDVHIPNHLHEYLDDLPPFPEKCVPPGSKGPAKLLTTLFPKEKYVIHYLLLKQAIKLGARVTKVHQALRFKQSKWLAEYVIKNGEFRKNSKNSFEDQLFKDMSNSAFGKFLENVRNLLNVELVVNEERLQKLVNKPNFKDRTIINDKVVSVELTRTNICFDRPAYVGQAILDLSKHIMFEFLYDVLLKLYSRDKIKLMYMDTDSFFLSLNTDDLYGHDMIHTDLKKYLDLSNFPTGHPTRCLDNERKLGSFKDETKGVPVQEYVGLRAKCYAYRVGDREQKKAKGVKSSAIKSQIVFKNYLTVLRKGSDKLTKFKTIRSYNHQIKTVEHIKRALTRGDDKRHILPGGVNTIAYGNNDRWEREILENIMTEDEPMEID